MKPDESADESDLEETVGGDYTVYECPGLAPVGPLWPTVSTGVAA